MFSYSAVALGTTRKLSMVKTLLTVKHSRREGVSMEACLSVVGGRGRAGELHEGSPHSIRMQLGGRGPIGGGCLAIVVFLFIEVILQYQMRGGHGHLRSSG